MEVVVGRMSWQAGRVFQMPRSQYRGPVDGTCCTVNEPRPGEKRLGPSASYSRPGVAPDRRLTDEQEKIAMDVTQLALDVIGVFEPTPFADGTNALISLARRDWLGAGLSVLGVVPYIGDLAKAGKLPKYIQTLHAAVAAARANAAFAARLRPVLQKLQQVLSIAPVENLSPRLAELVNSLRKPIDGFLGSGSADAATRAWWEVIDVGPAIRNSSIPEWIQIRVGEQFFSVARNAKKIAPNTGAAIGPATKHLAERAANADAWSKLSQIDFPMSALAGALEDAGKLLKSGKVDSGKIFRVQGWELGINSSQSPWVVFHAVYNPAIK